MLSPLSPLDALPFHSLYSGERRRTLERDWSRAHLPLSLPALLNAAVLAGLMLALAALPAAGLFLGDWTSGFLISCLIFALALAAGFALPSMFSRRFAAMSESDLPLALRAIALYLSIKMPLEQALARVAREDYASAPLWRSISQSIEGGQSVPRALSAASELVASTSFARAAAALTTYYEEGGTPDTLTALADDLGRAQSASLREQAAKAGVGGLVFVAASSILPAFALVLLVAAGPVLELPSDPVLIWLLFLAALPFLNTLVLSALLLGAPALAGAWRPQALHSAVNLRLKSYGLSGFSWREALLAAVLMAAAFFVLSQIASFNGWTLRIGLAVSLIPILFIALLEGEVLAQVSLAEAELPHLLLGAASAGRFSLERLLESAERMPAGPLREQARAALRQIRAGANPLLVLSDWAAHTPSVMLARALTLLAVGWRAGGSMAKPLRALASDALACGELTRERAAQLATQRYTLWAAGALLVPAILAVSLSFSAQVGSISAMASGSVVSANGMPAVAPAGSSDAVVPSSASGALDEASSTPASSASVPSAPVQAAAAAVPLYLLLNALLVALYLALASGARERFIPYAAALILCSQLVWLVLGPGA